jgi:hypothetical protein
MTATRERRFSTLDQETPGQDEVFAGWRAEWSSRRRRYFAEERDPTNPIDWDRRLIELHEPVLILRKPGRKFVEVKGESEIDRPVMLARGLTSAMLCDAHYAREWGDVAATLKYEAEAERWHRISDMRTNVNAVQRAGARLLAMPAGAGAKGTT